MSIQIRYIPGSGSRTDAAPTVTDAVLSSPGRADQISMRKLLQPDGACRPRRTRGKAVAVGKPYNGPEKTGEDKRRKAPRGFWGIDRRRECCLILDFAGSNDLDGAAFAVVKQATGKPVSVRKKQVVQMAHRSHGRTGHDSRPRQSVGLCASCKQGIRNRYLVAEKAVKRASCGAWMAWSDRQGVTYLSAP